MREKRGEGEREVSFSATWENETPCEALGVVREELPTLYTNSFISDVELLPHPGAPDVGVDVAEAVTHNSRVRQNGASLCLIFR